MRRRVSARTGGYSHPTAGCGPICTATAPVAPGLVLKDALFPILTRSRPSARLSCAPGAHWMTPERGLVGILAQKESDATPKTKRTVNKESERSHANSSLSYRLPPRSSRRFGDVPHYPTFPTSRNSTFSRIRAKIASKRFVWLIQTEPAAYLCRTNSCIPPANPRKIPGKRRHAPAIVTPARREREWAHGRFRVRPTSGPGPCRGH